MEDLKAKYAKPFKDLKDNICKTATAYTQYISPVSYTHLDVYKRQSIYSIMLLDKYKI